MGSKVQEGTRDRPGWLAYLVKRDHKVLQVQREAEGHQGHLGQKGLKEGKVTGGCKELRVQQARQEKLGARGIQDLLGHLVKQALLE